MLVLGMGIGQQTAIADSRRSRVTARLAVSFSLVIALIAALDHPLSKFMSISQQALVSFQMENEKHVKYSPSKTPAILVGADKRFHHLSFDEVIVELI